LVNTDKDYKAAIIAGLKRMFVQPLRQYRGIEKQLIQSAIILAKNCNSENTGLHMLSVIYFYKKYSFYETTPYCNIPLHRQRILKKM
jgi:GNAT superfamily N-acetyltransferase